MSQPQTQPSSKAVDAPPAVQRITRVDLRDVVSVADATASSFATDMSALGSAKAATGFVITPTRIGADGMPVALKAGEAWDGLKLSKVLMDRIRNVRVTHSAFVPKENVKEIVYSPE